MAEPTTSANKLILTVLLCHFLASFTALGMPVFYPTLLAEFLAPEDLNWIGFYYSLPLICMAVSAPFWGHMADRYGKRLSLLRAQIGLVFAFLVTGLATNLYEFTLGLVLQGLFGGTFAASNAYLACLVRPSELTKTQNWMQVSARLSLLLAPIVIGSFIDMTHPRQLFLYLSLLPLLAAVITFRLPKQLSAATPATDVRKGQSPAIIQASRTQVSVIQFCFYFATTVTFPYFLPWVQSLQALPAQTVGFLFSLPHLCYLLLMLLPVPALNRADGLRLVHIAIVLFVIANWQQAVMTTSDRLIYWRLLTGAALFLGLLGIHKLISALTHAGNSGRQFGWFDAIGKWSAVAAGMASGVVAQRLGLHSFFTLSNVMLVLAWLMVLYCQFYRIPLFQRTTNPAQTK